MYSIYDYVLLKSEAFDDACQQLFFLRFLFQGSRNKTYFSGGWIIMETTAKGYYVYSKTYKNIVVNDA